MCCRHQVSHWLRFGNNSFLVVTSLLSLRHGSRAALRAEMADIEQIQKVVPFITCESVLESKGLRDHSWNQHDKDNDNDNDS